MVVNGKGKIHEQTRLKTRIAIVHSNYTRKLVGIC
jgi:hypothetical protein